MRTKRGRVQKWARKWACNGGLSLLLAVGAASQVSATRVDENIDGALRKAAAAAHAKDCKVLPDIVAAETAKPGFARRPDLQRLYFYQLGLACAAEQEKFELAAHYAEAATGIAGTPAPFWQARFSFNWRLGRIAAAVTALEDVARAQPEALNATPIVAMFQFNRAVKQQKDPALRRRLLAVLAGPYVPPEPGMTTDSFRQDYAAILAEAGDKTGAAALVAQIEAPSALVAASLDPRLRALVPEPFDARAATERHMAHMHEIAAAHVGLIRPQLMVAQDLALLGKPQDVLAALDAITPGKPGGPSYADQTDQLNWWWDARARAYTALGRYDDAAAAFTQGKSLAESGNPNISQTINLAEAQLRFRRYADALTTLAPIGAGKIKGSPFGMAQYRAAHGCASMLAGKTADAQADLAYMREHADDAPGALIDIQLCIGDMDGAAATMIKRLDTPDERVDALTDLSDFAPPPPTKPNYPTAEPLVALKARADVQAAIARAGGVRRFNILKP